MRLDKRLIALFTFVTLLAASTVGVHLATASGPPVRTQHATVPLGKDGRFTVQFAGDTMLGDAAQKKLDRKGYDWPFQRVRRMLDGDYVIANAEGAISWIKKPYDPGKEYSYSSDPLVVSAMKHAGIDAVGLANNHAMDAGPYGLQDTLGFLADYDLPAIGAGPGVRRAEQPLLLETELGTLGVVALGESYGSDITADTGQAGTVALSPESIQRGIDLAEAAGADWVVAYVHWGDNYAEVNQQQRYWAKMLVRAGYDLVVGHGPHIVQPVRTVRGVPVFYSLGNFVFGTRGRFDSFGAVGVGLVLQLELDADADPWLTLDCVRTDNEQVSFQPRPCSPRQAKKVLPSLSKQIRMLPGGTAVLPCACFRPGGTGSTG